MALVVDLRITTPDGGTKRIGLVEIRRLEPLVGDDPRDEVHPYAVTAYIGSKTEVRVPIEHRYGDGAWAAAARALEHLDGLIQGRATS